MAEEEDTAGKSPASESSLAAALAMSGRALDPRAAAYLEKQSKLSERQVELVDLQIEELKREDSLRHWSLRVRHISDVLKLSLELTVALIVVVIAAGLIGAIWHAADADGLVIESFNVPASMTEKGLSGEVVASKLLDRLDRLQNETDSARAASSYSNDWSNDIKVEIPDTGISIGQIMRYLDNALGHQMHLSGDVYETAAGYALTIRLEGASGETFEGKDINAVVESAAEAAYRHAQPYRYSVYLMGQNRLPEAIAVDKSLAAGTSPVDRAWANEGLGILDSDAGHYPEARARFLRVLADIPDFPNASGYPAQLDELLGHDEDSLHEAERGLQALQGPGRSSLSSEFLWAYPHIMSWIIDKERGDYAAAAAETGKTLGRGRSVSFDAVPILMAIAETLNHDASHARVMLAGSRDVEPLPTVLPAPQGNTLHAEALIALEGNNWPKAAHDLEAENAADTADARSEDVSDTAARLRQNDPLLAYAYARMGDTAKADALLAQLPDDCYLCLRMRGRIRALEGNWGAADYWFARAVEMAPSLPHACAEWGEALVAKGDLEGAIVKFKTANEKGPHFADPLEMWGEALIRENRSDFAVEKFAEANKYAPNWGRLHLKWGEALFWSGNKAGAAKQFAIAAGLDLTPYEKSELARMRPSHG